MIISRKKFKLYADLIQRVATQKNNERASKCGYDIFMGLAGEGKKVKDRVNAWERFLKEKTMHNEEERNGVWVPAIPLK